MSSPSPFNAVPEVPSVNGVSGGMTLVEDSSFCLSDASGNMAPELPQGLFFRDTRILSALVLLLDGERVEPLVCHQTEAYAATFVGRGRSAAGEPDSGLVVRRDRWVGRGLREDLTVTNYRDHPAQTRLTLRLDADFAGVFDVKAGRAATGGTRSVARRGTQLVLRNGDGSRGAAITLSGWPRSGGLETHFVLDLPPGGSWSSCIEVAAELAGELVEPYFRCGEPAEAATPTRRIVDWRRRVPVVQSDPARLERAVGRSQEDLGALRMIDPDHPGDSIVAAGAPWYMTLFGRDSLLTSWFSLPVDPDLAVGVLRALARLQGKEVVPATEEQPGRIPHEVRYQGTSSLSLGAGSVYYGTVDATPLFVMLLGELRRWGLAEQEVQALLPHADRALDWLTGPGDPDGDGFVEYQRMTPNGLRNQGWKDSWDGVRDASGHLGEGPIALAEVQGYAYAAFLARAFFADQAGDAALAADWRGRAARLRQQFNEAFWLPDKGWFAMALDGDKRPLDALTSTIGHCLWTGIADEDKAAEVARHLLSPEVFSGWGLRTLATSMTGYNPLSYHNGSVWPHDSAIAAAGLMRYGHVEEALRLCSGLLDAGAAFSDRLPELFGGLDRGHLGVPLTYPASCSPQAWAAAAPLLLLRTVLRLDPAVPQGRVWLDPVLPEGTSTLRVSGLRIAGARVDVEVGADGAQVSGLPAEVALVREPRRPLTEAG